jgi:iron(III) transport system substrate-binding protein
MAMRTARQMARSRMMGCVSLAVTVVLAALAPSACARAAEADAGLDALVQAAKAEGTVMIYHTSAPRILKPVMNAFTAKYGIPVRNFYATGTPLSVRFASEVAVGTVQADVFYTSDTSIFEDYPKNFQPLDAKSLPNYPALPDYLRLASGLAVSSVQLSYSMFYNIKRVSEDERPRTWKDLADPKWKGRSLMIEPRSSLSFRAPYNVIRTLHPGILSRIADNEPRIAETGTAAVQQLAAGTGSIAFAGYPGHAQPLILKGAPVRWAALEEPAIARRSWIGAVRGPRPNAARLLVHFLTSIDGLKAFCASGDGSMAALDPSGKQTGCHPLSANAHFLSDAPMSDEDSAETLRQLRLQ